MPVEIRELVIKAFIEEADSETSASTSDNIDKEEIIADCMEQLSEMLKQQMER
jgi:hypothetical protein